METANREFSFERRPLPVPGDLRISWRVAVLLLMIGYSRSARASLPKLYILNNAIRSEEYAKLSAAIAGKSKSFEHPQVEPAFARAIDLIVGEKLAEWTRTSGRAGLSLTVSGVKAATAVAGLVDTLTGEREFLQGASKTLTESIVTRLIGEASKTA